MEIFLKESERIDDLEINNLKIIQNKNGFCFGMDSVLLSDFAKTIKTGSSVIDLGTGTGILPILLSSKTKKTKFTGIEIQNDVAQMAQKSVKLNNLEDRIEILNLDILELKQKYKKGNFDVVITNPPYKKINSGIINVDENKMISKHEITASLEDFIESATYLLKDLGEFYMVHRPNRLVDIFNIMRNKKIEPKKIRFVFPNKNKNANLILIKGIKNAKPFLQYENNLYIYDEKENYTEEVLKIYNRK